MSFKIFSLQLLGKIKPTEKIEQKRESLYKDYIEYQETKKSEELAEFLKLESEVNSEDFKRKKAEIKALKFKGSNEYSQQQEFEKLKKARHIKLYFKAKNSPELKRYERLKDSDMLKEYQQLREYKDNGGFRDDKKRIGKKEYKGSDEEKKWFRYKELTGNSDIKFAQKYGKSKIYKNYLNVKDSADLKRYHELDETISSSEFQKRKAYLEDSKKWEKSEGFEKERKYEEMKKRPRIEKYFKYKDSSAFAFFEEWVIAFEDNFAAPALTSEKWSTRNYVAQKLLEENYSLAGDLNIFTNGKNVKTGGRLIIETKREKTEGKIWNPAAGFIPVELDYSSGLVSTGQSFWQEDGIYEVKVRFNPVKQVVSAFYLQGEQNLPRVNLFEMGTKNRVGISTLNEGQKLSVNGLDISNLKKNRWYIFTLEKSSSRFTWKINETEVHQVNDSKFSFPMHLNASTLVVNEIPGSNLPVHFEIDWVRCYRKK